MKQTLGPWECEGIKRDACALPVCVHEGYRSVPLKNSYSEDLELASLLVHMDIIKGRVGYEFIVCR